MSRRFEIHWPDFEITVRCRLMDAENLELCDEFWRGLPFTTIMAASMSAGEMLKIPIPMALPEGDPDQRAFFPEVPPGTLLSLGWGSLLMKYGVVAEPFRLPVVAQVEDQDIPSLFTVAGKIREAYFFTKVIYKATFRAVES